MIRILSPIAYAASVAIVFVCVVAAFGVLETSFGFNAVWVRAGLVLLVIATAFAGVAFSYATVILANVEHIARPGWRDHLRHSALLYAVAGWWIAWLIDTRPTLGRGVQWGLVATATMLLLLAAIVNAVTLLAFAMRSARRARDTR